MLQNYVNAFLIHSTAENLCCVASAESAAQSQAVEDEMKLWSQLRVRTNGETHTVENVEHYN